ncbi:MAG: cytochrome c biogenesis protein CcdA [Firmicutes bacterium]|nr:cytochrome c biogenesis protein CcdA [Bacillota bacterium]
MVSSFVLWVAFAAGVLSFLSPCLLPMLAVYFTLITGMSMSELQNIDNEARFRRHVLINTLLFVIAFGIVFTIAGGVAGQLGQLLQRNLKYLTIIGGVFILILSLRLLGVLKLSFLDRLSLHGLVDDANWPSLIFWWVIRWGEPSGLSAGQLAMNG